MAKKPVTKVIPPVEKKPEVVKEEIPVVKPKPVEPKPDEKRKWERPPVLPGR